MVAFTIEWDNEAEHRLPHRTQDYGLSAGAPAGAPWLTSLVMWANCVRHVPEDGITVAALRRRARTGTNLDGMRRWRYVTYTPDPGRGKRPKSDAVMRLTAWGQAARRVWDGLDAEIEGRWRDRFGGAGTGGLPILGYGMYSRLDPDGA